jgi:hypothetical protein
MTSNLEVVGLAVLPSFETFAVWSLPYPIAN